MVKSARNKTIDIPIDDGIPYLSKCLSLNMPASLSQVIDQTILGNFFDVVKYLPEKSVDLLLTDPPYNLDKNFHDNRFKRVSDVAYEDYVDTWIRSLIPTLKDTASLYICCDWRSSGSIEQVLKRYFYVQNRIT